MIRRYGLWRDQWERIEGLLPGRAATVGVTAKDKRLFVEAVRSYAVESGGIKLVV